MEQILNSEKSNFNKKTPIIALSLSSLVLTLISCITYFVYYLSEYNDDGEQFYKLTPHFPSILSLLDLVIFISPFVLFVVYLLNSHNKYKATICVPITFGLVAYYPVFQTIVLVLLGQDISFRDLIIDLPLVICFVLLTISALKGLSKKALIIATVCGLLNETFYIYNFVTSINVYIENEVYLYLITHPIRIVGTILFYIAILLFGLKNRIPSIITVLQKMENTGNISPEQSLRMLKLKLDCGMITGEEYQTQRAEIISKL